MKLKIFLFFMLLISLINAKENEEVKNEKDDNNKESDEKIKINFINCDKYCSKFEPTCPLIYNEVIPLAIESIVKKVLTKFTSAKTIPIGRTLLIIR